MKYLSLLFFVTLCYSQTWIQTGNGSFVRLAGYTTAGDSTTVNTSYTTTGGSQVATGKSQHDTLVTSHIIGLSSAPTIARGAGSGTTSTVAVTGTDIAGLITVSTAGTAPTANGIIATITFNKGFTNPAKVVLTPASGIAAQEIAKVKVTTTGTTFILTDTVTALTNAKLYQWFYHAFE